MCSSSNLQQTIRSLEQIPSNLQPNYQHLQAVRQPTLYTTAFRSPQVELIELDDEQWRKFQRHPARNYAKRIAMLGHQLSLLDLGTSALIIWALKAL